MSSFATEGRALERARPLPARIRAVARGAALGALSRLPRGSGPGVRIVHYHYVFDDERERFAEQLRFLSREFRPVSLSQAVERLRLGQTSGDEVVVTFDDGFRNQLDNAAPLLAEHGFSACFFLVTDLLDANADQARAFSRDKLHLPLPVEPLDWDGASRLLELGHEIGSHTRSHPNLTSLRAGGPARRAGDLARGALEATRSRAPRQRALRRPRALLGGGRRRGAKRGVRELRVGDPRRQPLRARPVLAAPPSPERVLAASRARVLPRVNVVVLTRNPHGIASRFLARRPGPVILDEAVGRRDVRRTLRKLRRVGFTAAPVGLALRRAYADAGSGPTLESVATEVVRVPSLNGNEARDALRRLGADVAISLDNAIIRPETFSLPAHGTINVHHGAVPGYRGGPPVFWELRDGLDRVGFTIHLIDAGIDTGPVLARGDVPIERRSTLAETLAATIPAPARGEPRRARGRARRGRLRGRAPAVRRAPPHDADARRLPPRPQVAPRLASSPLFLVKTLFWGALAALAWTHVAYPAAAVAAARLRPRPVRKGDDLPSVSVIVAAHDEEDVIERRLENLLELDYPDDKLELAVASDASTDATDELVEREPRVRLIRCPRGGKVAAQNQAVRETSGEIVAFSDANATWAPSALRELVRNFADPDVAYVCGQLRLDDADGTNREGAYWRYELGVRAAESQLHSVTGGNGSIYAVRRSDYVDVDPRFGHDLSFPYLMVQRGRRAVYEPEAVAFEKPTPNIGDEYRRKVRMFEHCWAIVLEGRHAARARAALPGGDRLAPAPALRVAGCSTSSRSGRTRRCSARARSTARSSPASSRSSASPRFGPACRATTCS